MKKNINTNANAIVFAQAQDNNKAVVATRDGKEVYLAWALKNANEENYGKLGGKRVEGVKHFRVEFPTVKNAKSFIATAITELSADDYAKTRKTEPKAKAEKKASTPTKSKGKKADDLVTVTLVDGTQLQVSASALGIATEPKKAPRKSKGDKPTTAPNAKAKSEPKAEKIAPRKAKGNATLTDAQKKALDKAKMSILNRAASAYSIANGGEATNFKALGKTEAELKAYIPNAKAGLLKSSKWAKAVEMGITEDMLG